MIKDYFSSKAPLPQKARYTGIWPILFWLLTGWLLLKE